MDCRRVSPFSFDCGPPHPESTAVRREDQERSVAVTPARNSSWSCSFVKADGVVMVECGCRCFLFCDLGFCKKFRMSGDEHLDVVR